MEHRKKPDFVAIAESLGFKRSKLPKGPVDGMCPFCYGHNTYTDYGYVYCVECGARGPAEPRNGSRSFHDLAVMVWREDHKK